MSGPNPPGDIPPDLPPEYAEAYRRGFERAFVPVAEHSDHTEDEGDEGHADNADADRYGDQYADLYADDAPRARGEQTERQASLESLDSAFRPVDSGDPQARPVHRDQDERNRRRLLAPLVLVGLGLLLIVAAYGLGRVFSGQVSSTDTTPEPGRVVLGEDGASSDTTAQDHSNGPKQKTYEGQVGPAAIGGASASCQTDGGVDAAGHKVAYDPANMFDGDDATAWRCDGNGVGERVTVQLADETRIGEVGLIPGYAKTDASNGVDRYAENNRITRVRWQFSDGSSQIQKLDGSPTNRDLQTMRIPETDADQVVIEILGYKRGARNTVAISEVSIGRVAG